MSLKKRIVFYVSSFFSVLFGVISIIVYLQFSSFRSEESKDRLEEKAVNTMKLLIEVKEVDHQLLKLIDSNAINKLYNEKTLIFNDKYELLYSSVDDAVIKWTIDDLKKLKNKKEFFKTLDKYDFFGMYYDSQSQDYYALVLAEDKYGNRKLQYLSYLLIMTFIAGTCFVWLVSSFFIKSLVAPLDAFQKKITNITENNLTLRLEENLKKDEINLMAKAFNQMMKRIQDSYNGQKEFTSNASHELRTPIARVMTQVENLMNLPGHSPETMVYLKNIASDAEQMGDLVNSLLLLSRAENNLVPVKPDLKRIDELIFEAIEITKISFPDLWVNFSISENNLMEESLEINCNEGLLRIAFVNLIRNAYLYSEDKKITIEIEQISANSLSVRIVNKGMVLNDSEKTKLFQAFMRGKNAKSTNGTGLGLRITQRILYYHGATISYNNENDILNVFTIIFNF